MGAGGMPGIGYGIGESDGRSDGRSDGGTERRFGNGATLMLRLTNRFALEDVADVCGTD